MNNNGRTKLFSILIVVILLLQMIPANSAYGVTPSNITGTQYLTVHGTDYIPSERASSLILTEADGITVINPDSNGDYNDIPAGAKILLDLGFTLEDGSEDTIYDYDGNEFFTVTLPDGLNFSTTSGTLVATDATDGNYAMAIWTISGNTLLVELTTADEDSFGNGGAENDNHFDKWGKIHIEGTFNALNAGDGTTETITFGSQTITINRQPLPMTSTLEKSGVYDASTNQITWTVTVTPPAGAPDQAFDGFTVIDEYSGNQAYVSESFAIGGDSIPDSTLAIDSGSRTVIYEFPDTDPDTTGTQTITYKTAPVDFSAENGTSAEFSTYSNTVSLYRGSDPAADDDTSSVDLDWINKSGSMVDTSAADPTVVKWEVDITVPGATGSSISGATIIDVIPTDLELFTDTSHPVTIKFGSNPETNVSSGTGDGEYSYLSNILIYRFASDSQPAAGTTARLTFYTRVTAAAWSAYLNTNDPISFSNSASLNWTQNTTETFPGDSYTISEGIGEGGLLSKSGGSTTNYAYSVSDPGTIQWTIVVNRNEVNIVNARITDNVPADQMLLIDESHPFIVTGLNSETITSASSTSNFTYTDQNNFTYEFSEETAGTDTISTQYTVTFYTRIVDPNGLDKLYSNGNKNYLNSVTLTSDSSSAVSETGQKTYRSQMVSKSISTAYNYNPAERTIQWRIVVNRNLLPLSNAVVSDTLPEGMTLLIDTEHPFSVTASGTGGLGILSGSSGDSSFTYTLPALTSDQYTITFWAKMNESALITQWEGTKGFRNQASLDSEEIVSPIISRSTADIKNPVISKTYDYTTGNDTITWSVEINNAQILLQNAVINDTLNASLTLDPDSVNLYEITIDDSTGNANPGGVLVDPAEYGVTLPTAGNGNVLSVALPQSTTKAYRLVFQTLILTDDIDLSNTVDISGSTGDPAGSSTSTQIVVNDLYSTGGSGTNTLTVHKTDSEGNPLEGATFRLLNVNQQPIYKNENQIVATTDSSGDAIFSSLPSWVFYIEEIEPNPGYLIPEDSILGGNRLEGTETINFTNSLALTDVTFNKTGADGALLNGGTFTLSGLDYDSNPVSFTASAVNGIVTFEDIMPNLEGTPYTITETAVPDGHTSTSATLLASVTYSESKKSLVVTVTPETLVNTPETGTVSFGKTGTGGELLDGGSFTLSGTDYNDNPVSITGVEAMNGVVTFSSIPLGTYSITEVSPPDGYLMPAEAIILTAEVTYSDGFDSIETIIKGTGPETPEVTSYENIQAFGTLSFTKVDSTNMSEISGGVFTLTGKDYSGSDVLLTSSSVGGTVTFNNVPLGDDYTIRETTPPPGYRLTSTELNASVSYNEDKTSVITFISGEMLSNDRAPSYFFAPVSVLKTDEEGIPLVGAEFTLYDRLDREVSKAVSGSDGVARFGNVVNGIFYKILETKAPEGYEINEDEIVFSIISTDPLSFTVVNTKSTIEYGSITIVKTSETGDKLADAEFVLYTNDGDPLQSAVTQIDGTAQFSNIPAGLYTIKETRAPNGYSIDHSELSVEVHGNEVIELTFVNTPEMVEEYEGEIQVTKVDKNNMPLANAEFTLFNADGAVIGKLISDSAGVVRFTGLKPGKYSIKETVSPEGYELYDGPAYFQIRDSIQSFAYRLKNKLNGDDTEIVYWTDDEFPAGSPENPSTGTIPASLYLLFAGILLALGSFAIRHRADEAPRS
ncbi:MAG TPA: SpaA isopeptide-forming pilin-related protein [Clostridia bacterium]|nr:SpaA isopeptide-forming pilin-related protein [Clostridia bacterium]